MSSWIRGAFESVKEKSTTLRHRVSQVRVGGRSASTVEAAIEALEMRAAQVRNVQALVALYREWLAAINEAEESVNHLIPDQEVARSLAPMYTESVPSDEAFGRPKQLNFTQVLLRSRAVEETLCSAVRVTSGPRIHTTIAVGLSKNWPPQTASSRSSGKSSGSSSPTVDDDGSSVAKERTLVEAAEEMEREAAVLLHELLSRLLNGSPAVWEPVVAHLLSTNPEYLYFDTTDAAPPSCRTPGVQSFEKARDGGDGCAWSLSILSDCLKKDWNTEWLICEMKRNGIEADCRRQELMVAANKRPEDGDWDRWFDARLAQSEGLVHLWGRLNDHAKTSIDSRAEHEKKVASKCDRMVQSSTASSQRASSMVTTQQDAQSRDAAGLASQEKRVDEQMEAMMADRKEVDARIAALEAKKQSLRLQLEKVSEDLVEAQRQQVLCMQREESVRKSLADTKESYNQSIKAAEAAETKFNRLHDRFDEVATMAGSSKDAVAQTDDKAGVELKKKLSQINQAYIGTCREHLRFIEDRMNSVSSNVKKLAQQKEALQNGSAAMLAGFTSAAAITGVDSADGDSNVLNTYTARTNEATMDQIEQIRSQLFEDSRRLSACRQAAIDFVQPLKSKIDVETFRLEGERIESLYRHALVVLKHAEVDADASPAGPPKVAQNEGVLEETASICITPPNEEAPPNDGQEESSS
ncbi:hypothetical protein FOZ62_001385 [Perkinsus olseni]|uniref:Uncharacterized protein n=1 Tax=Perkinsus olseni TaxID=32597 RepID=A0A7J6S6L2_PEROL|nr:hypothetical protein FOZ62_001385 [Perkinsus olseni]